MRGGQRTEGRGMREEENRGEWEARREQGEWREQDWWGQK